MHHNNFGFLRLMAALAVVYSHYLRVFNLGDDNLLKFTNNYTDIATLGVISFFIMSGFLVTRSMLSSKNRFQFLYNRILRIFPGYVACLLVSVFFLGLLATHFDFFDYMKSLQTYAYFLNVFLYTFQYQLPGVFENNPHQYNVNAAIWTLWIEFTAYLLLFSIYKKKNLKSQLIFGILLTSIITFILFKYKILLAYQIHLSFGDIFVYFLNISAFFRFLLFFLIGSFFALRADDLFSNLSIFFGVSILYVFSLNSSLYNLLEYMCLPYIILYVSLKNFKALNSILYRVGDLSYGIYLYHYPIGQYVWYFSQGKIPLYLSVIISLLLTISMAYFSWKYIEKPFLKLKKYSYSEVKEQEDSLIPFDIKTKKRLFPRYG